MRKDCTFAIGQRQFAARDALSGVHSTFGNGEVSLANPATGQRRIVSPGLQTG